MTLTRKHQPEMHPPLSMNNTAIKEELCHTHLGLTFSKSCTWNQHINNISADAWVRLNLLRSFKFKINRKALEKTYISFIRPLLEFSDSAWDNCSNETKKKKQLDTIHIEAGRLITGATKLCRWESLQERRTKHKLITFYIIIDGLTPRYLTDLIPPLVQETAPYSLRNSDDIQTFHSNTNLFMPPKELRWHIKIEPSVRPFVCPSVSPSVTNRVSAISHKLLEQI